MRDADYRRIVLACDCPAPSLQLRRSLRATVGPGCSTAALLWCNGKNVVPTLSALFAAAISGRSVIQVQLATSPLTAPRRDLVSTRTGPTRSQAAGADGVSRLGLRCPQGLLDLLRRGLEPGVFARAPVILPPGRRALKSGKCGDFLAGRGIAASGLRNRGVGGVAHGW